MKRITPALLLLFCITTFAQQGINYKAVIKDGSGAVVSSSAIDVTFIVLDGAVNVYEETHNATTDANGIIIVNIGEGSPVSGTLISIDWSSNNHFLNVQIDTGGGLQDMGTTAFKSVPYALRAETAANGLPAGGTTGQILILNNSGIPVWTDPSIGTFYIDNDNDGYGDINNTTMALIAPIGYVDNNNDCNDNDPLINPDTVWYLDFDGDNYAVSTLTQCMSPGAGYSTTVVPLTDCNDADPLINPDTVWYLDSDGDNYAISTTTQCASPGAGYSITVLPVTDCNDADPLINPDTVWYFDSDGDNYAVSTMTQCISPGTGYTTVVLPLTDCNDSNPLVNPGMTEVCGNGIDDNCDLDIDEGCPAAVGDLRAGGVVFWVDPADNTHGLVCALLDYDYSGGVSGEVEWGCFGTNLSIPDVDYIGTNTPPFGPGAEIGDGITNTNGILLDCSSAPAALAARSYGVEWFLPSVLELHEIYLNKATLDAVSGFVPLIGPFYCSTEYNGDISWLQNFPGGAFSITVKTGIALVRPVKAF